MMKRIPIISLFLLSLLLGACGATAVDDIPTATPIADETPNDAYPPADAYPPSEQTPVETDNAYPVESEAVKEETPVAYPGLDLQAVTPVPIEEDNMSEEAYPAEEPGADVPAAIYEMSIVQEMIQDLSQQAQIAPENVAIVSFEEVTWRDSSLGCPRPGMEYLQVLTEGFKVVLEADGEQYDYHASGNRFVLCR